jgi:RNA polymerase sigma-70 factor (ECF subfamily)
VTKGRSASLARRKDAVLPDGDDDALIEAAKGGDEQAFDRLIRRHAPRTHAVARRVLGNDADADDATQEVFWRAWQALARWRPGEAKLGTWLYRITVNVCLDRHRRTRRTAEVVDETSMAEAGDPAPGQEQRLAGRQALAAVLAAVSRLSADQRMALVLSVQQNLSNREVAAAMGTSEGAVEQLLVRARRALRQVHRSIT